MNDLRFGTFRLEPTARLLFEREEAVPITGKVFDLLYFMALNANRVLPRSELQSALWPDSFVEESSLSQNIFVLRKALGKAGDGMIVTLPGRGYQFTARVECLPLNVPERSADPVPDQAPQHQTLQTTATRILYVEKTEEHISPWRSPVAVTLVAMAAVLAGVAGWLGWQRWQDRVGGPPVQVVLADPNGSTGDSVLDRTLTSATRIGLSQSPFISLVSQSAVRDTLKQMLHNPNDVLSSDTARDVCERTGSQAVVQQSIARAGSHFLLTEEATNCADGSLLSAAHEEASRAEDLPKDIEKLNVAVRHGMGESRRTIARFNAPLATAVTPSLEALKLWTEAQRMNLEGRFAEGAELNREAIAVDPQFATAYFDLGLAEFNTAGESQMRAHLQRAYDLRDRTIEPVRLAIEACYELWIIGDAAGAERAYVKTLELYPRSTAALAGLASLYINEGRHAEELAIAKRLLPLTPNRLASYQTMAQAQLSTGDPAGARQTCELALRRGLDGGNIRQVMVLIAYYQGDAAFQAQQQVWREAHPGDTYLRFVEIGVLLGEGRTREAMTLFNELHTYHLQERASSAASRVSQGTAAALFALGEPQQARELLHMDPPLPEYSTLQARIDLGEGDAAMSELGRQLQMQPRSTLWHQDYAPLLRGQLALAAGRSTQAIAELERSHKFDGREPDNLYYLGEAYLQAGRFAEAEQTFRALLGRQYFDLAPYLIPLAHLQLARTLLKERKDDDSDREYKSFLHLWSGADREQPLLSQAVREEHAFGR